MENRLLARILMNVSGISYVPTLFIHNVRFFTRSVRSNSFVECGLASKLDYSNDKKRGGGKRMYKKKEEGGKLFHFSLFHGARWSSRIRKVKTLARSLAGNWSDSTWKWLQPDGMRIVDDHQSRSRNNEPLTFTRHRFLPWFPGDN